MKQRSPELMTYAVPPNTRLRRLRKTDSLRALVRENKVTLDDLIFPLFVEETLDERVPISSLPGMFRETEDSIGSIIKDAYNLGIHSIVLFGVSHNKDFEGSDSFSNDGLMSRMIKRAKDACPEITVITDLCFCEYTDHGHCGPLTKEGDVDNDATLENLAKQAIVAAESGSDIVAPSGMMDGMIATIRNALDDTGHQMLPILSYSAKYASSYYGPFREAAGCSLGIYEHAKKDRATYQMDSANSDEALREVEQDLFEGADMVMVKPGLPYLDVITRVKDTFKMPTFAYNVSGEYAMLHAAAEKGWLDYDSALMEMLLCFKRAGADGVLTYGAMDAAKILNK